ncbi:MAG: alpha/beta fold hydrolase [Pseudomonadota bacterium]
MHLRFLASSLVIAMTLSACGTDTIDDSTDTSTPPPSTTPKEEPEESPVVTPPVVVPPVIAEARVASFRVPGRTVQTAENSNEASCARKANLTGGRHHQVILTSASGKDISFEVIEPKVINCTVGNPLMLHGHGFGGSRTIDPSGSFLERLQNNGYAVISIDQRGFGESTGTVRVMDPNFEGQDLLQILDWAEKHLDYLAQDTANRSDYNLVAGSTGGSYGGMYQMLIHNTDPKHRLDVLTPDITPHDLRYSLNPGNAVKSAWVALLSAGGEAGASEKLVGGLDPVIKETLVRGLATNRIHDGALPFFYYHSVRYFTDAKPASEQTPMDFLGAPLYSGLNYDSGLGYDTPATKPLPVSILFTQGMRDTLFNFNDGWDNFRAYRALGGDVRLFTHETGHLLPGTQTVLSQAGPLGAGINQITAQLQAGGLSTPELQQPSGSSACGTTNREDTQLAFINEKLNPPNAVAVNAEALSRLELLKTKVCLSLGDKQAAWVGFDQIENLNRVKAVAIPATTLPVPNSVLGLTSVPQPTFIPLAGLPAARRTVAGIGRMQVTLALPSVPMNGCSISAAAPAEFPIRGCDAAVFVGWGARKGSSAPRLLDEQVTPVRGLGTHDVRMVGVADALADGEELGLLVYGYHLQYLTSISRDLLVPAVTISGTVDVPLLNP